MTIAHNSPIEYNKINDVKVSEGLYAYSLIMEEKKEKYHFELMKLDILGKLLVGQDLGLSKRYECAKKHDKNDYDMKLKQEMDFIAGAAKYGFTIINN